MRTMMSWALCLVGAASVLTNQSFANADICEKYAGETHRLQNLTNGQWQEFCRIGNGPFWGSGGIIGAATLADWDKGQSNMAIDAFRKHEAYKALPPAQSSGNPAIDYCRQVGGDVQNVDTVFRGENLGETGICVFNDASMIDEWALMRHDQNLAAVFDQQPAGQPR